MPPFASTMDIARGSCSTGPSGFIVLRGGPRSDVEAADVVHECRNSLPRRDSENSSPHHIQDIIQPGGFDQSNNAIVLGLQVTIEL